MITQSHNHLRVLALAVAFAVAATGARAQTMWYVNDDAAGANTGLTWADAFTDLQAALAVGSPCDEIWVAEGVYRPAGPGGPRTVSFQLVDGVGLYGGFEGIERRRCSRRPAERVTVLSGDLNGDDGPGFANNGENSYHVVRADLTIGDVTVLDGFTITGGNADAAASPDERGAGMLNIGGSPTVNACHFVENASRQHAGGIYAEDCNSLITNSAFCFNESGVGASGGGTGMFIADSSPTLVNCLFDSNHHVGNNGEAALYVFSQSDATLVNCTFFGNTTTQHYSAVFVHPDNTQPTLLVNCIIWGNNLTQIGGGPLSITYSCIEGGWAGTGNIADDPRFVDSAGHDFHLRSVSPCIDAGDNSAPFLDEHDLDGYRRIVDGDGDSVAVVDMGVFEYREICADLDGDGDVDIVDLAILLAGYGTTCP